MTISAPAAKADSHHLDLESKAPRRTSPGGFSRTPNQQVDMKTNPQTELLKMPTLLMCCISLLCSSPARLSGQTSAYEYSNVGQSGLYNSTDSWTDNDGWHDGNHWGGTWNDDWNQHPNDAWVDNDNWHDGNHWGGAWDDDWNQHPNDAWTANDNWHDGNHWGGAWNDDWNHDIPENDGWSDGREWAGDEGWSDSFQDSTERQITAQGTAWAAPRNDIEPRSRVTNAAPQIPRPSLVWMFHLHKERRNVSAAANEVPMK